MFESYSDWLAYYANAFYEKKFQISAGVPVIYGNQST
jgi:hypothetical protein